MSRKAIGSFALRLANRLDVFGRRWSEAANRESRARPSSVADVALAAIERSLSQTTAVQLRAFHLEFVRRVETKEIALPPQQGQDELPRRYAVRHFLTRLANEIGGVVGCLYWGTPLASLHHARAIMELAACANHLSTTVEQSKLERRWRRLAEFEDAARAAHYERQCSYAGLAAYATPVAPFTDSDVAFFKSKRDDWRKLYGLEKKKELAELAAWHQPVSVRDLFAELPGPEHWRTYGLICNSTHFSPLGERLGKNPNGGYPLFVVGKEPVELAVNVTAQYTRITAERLHAIAPMPNLLDLCHTLP